MGTEIQKHQQKAYSHLDTLAKVMKPAKKKINLKTLHKDMIMMNILVSERFVKNYLIENDLLADDNTTTGQRQ
jgi:hypothetical protein